VAKNLIAKDGDAVFVDNIKVAYAACSSTAAPAAATTASGGDKSAWTHSERKQLASD
jgi:hypothetical protein